MKFFNILFFVVGMCTNNFAQMPPKVLGRTHMQTRSSDHSDVLVSTDRLVTSLENKLSNLIRNEVNGLRHELQKNDHASSLAEKVLQSYEAIRQSINNIQVDCLQSQIFDNHQDPNSNNNNSAVLGKIDNLQNMLASLRVSANRIEKDLTFVKKSTRTMNVKSHHPMMLPRSDYHDHESACTATEMNSEPGVKMIRRGFFAFCEVTQDDGNWIVIQNRVSGHVNFFRNWNEYKEGFGNVAGGDFWLGLEKIFELTSSKLHELLIVMEDSSGKQLTARYSAFGVSSEASGYALNVLGQYTGNAGDSLTYHAGMKFSTYDVDNDEWADGSCAKSHFAGWWFNKCDMCNLNGILNGENSNEMQTMHWKPDKHSTIVLKHVKMMIRPID